MNKNPHYKKLNIEGWIEIEVFKGGHEARAEIDFLSVGRNLNLKNLFVEERDSSLKSIATFFKKNYIVDELYNF